MARTTISIPDDLKMRMDEQSGINWSGIAQRAFELELRTRPKGDNMEAVKERLRASKQKLEEEQRPAFVKDGREWAMHHAAFDKLKAVAEIDADDCDESEDGKLLPAIMFAVHGEDHGLDWSDMNEFFTGDGRVRPSFNQLCWWLEGAQQVWEEVKDDL